MGVSMDDCERPERRDKSDASDMVEDVNEVP